MIKGPPVALNVPEKISKNETALIVVNKELSLVRIKAHLALDAEAALINIAGKRIRLISEPGEVVYPFYLTHLNLMRI